MVNFEALPKEQFNTVTHDLPGLNYSVKAKCLRKIDFEYMVIIMAY